MQANPEEFIPIFANNSRELKAFLEHMSAVQPDSPQGVYDTLLELRLQNWAHEQDPQVCLASGGGAEPRGLGFLPGTTCRLGTFLAVWLPLQVVARERSPLNLWGPLVAEQGHKGVSAPPLWGGLLSSICLALGVSAGQGEAAQGGHFLAEEWQIQERLRQGLGPLPDAQLQGWDPVPLRTGQAVSGEERRVDEGRWLLWRGVRRDVEPGFAL